MNAGGHCVEEFLGDHLDAGEVTARTRREKFIDVEKGSFPFQLTAVIELNCYLKELKSHLSSALRISARIARPRPMWHEKTRHDDLGGISSLVRRVRCLACDCFLTRQNRVNDVDGSRDAATQGGKCCHYRYGD